MGQLVRVLPGLYESRPNPKELALQKELYFVFYTLASALRSRQVEIISNEPVPVWARRFPIMRHPGLWDRGGNPINWLIGDGEKGMTLDNIPKMLNVTELTPDQQKISISVIRPHPAMVKALAGVGLLSGTKSFALWM